MSSTETATKTVKQVEKLTGIPRRKVKYFIERGIFLPSKKSDSGYWLYSDSDVERLQFIALCKELDWPDDILKTMLANPDFPWLKELDRQIERLREKACLCENKLIAVRFLREQVSTGSTATLETLHQEVLAIIAGGAPALEMLKEKNDNRRG